MIKATTAYKTHPEIFLIAMNFNVTFFFTKYTQTAYKTPRKK